MAPADKLWGSIMNYKQKLLYTLLGAVIMLVGIGVGSIVSPPLVAEKNGVFDEIVCTKLTVVDKAGKEGIVLRLISPMLNSITIFDPETGKKAVDLSASLTDNNVMVFHREGKRAAALRAIGSGESPNARILYAEEMGNGVSVYDREGNLAARLGSDEASNSLDVYDKVGKQAIDLLADNDSSIVMLFDKAGQRAIFLGAGNESNNNLLSVYNKAGETGVALRTYQESSVSVYDKAGTVRWSTP